MNNLLSHLKYSLNTLIIKKKLKRDRRKVAKVRALYLYKNISFVIYHVWVLFILINRSFLFEQAKLNILLQTNHSTQHKKFQDRTHNLTISYTAKIDNA